MRIFLLFQFFLLLNTACSDSSVNLDNLSKSEEKDIPKEKDSIGVFKWESELCNHEGTFNARLYSITELDGTHQLLSMVGGMLLSEINGTAFNPGQIGDLSSLEELDTVYGNKRKALLNLKIVNDPYWKKVKKALLGEMKDEYDLTRIGIQAYTNPAVLKGNRFSHSCPDIIKALTDQDTNRLMAEWKALMIEQCKSNGSPEHLMKRFQEESNHPDRLLYARTELITFGWHNQVNETLPSLPHDEKINKKFDQLFLKTTSECDGP